MLRDLDDEVRFHLEMRIRDLEARGMSRVEAEAEAHRRFGDAAELRRWSARTFERRMPWARFTSWLGEWAQDLRFTVRQLCNAPGFTATALLTMALGIGATTTLFRVADALLVRTFPYRDASRVFVLRRVFTLRGEDAFTAMSKSAFQEWRERSRSIEAAVPFSRADGPLGTGADTVPVTVAAIDTDFLAFAGARPLLGRNFTSEEITPTGPGPMLIAEDFWRRHYGASTSVLGTVVQVGSRPRTIVGVIPASLSLPDFQFARPDVWVPISPTEPNIPGVIVRLKPGVSPETAAREATAIFRPPPVPWLATGMETRMRLVRPQDKLAFRDALITLTGAVALLLLVACTNVAHLLLARGVARQREIAVRFALGAGRARILRQLVNESVVLSAVGGALALVVGWGGLRLLAATRPPSLTALTHVSADRGIVPLASVLAITAGLAIGLVFALRTAHGDLGSILRASSSSTSASGSRLRSALVVGEVALSTTLLVGALVLIHAVYDLQHMRLGFDANHLYAVAFRSGAKETPGQRVAFAALAEERASRIPGVQQVALGDVPGPRSWTMLSAFETPERPAIAGAERGTALRVVGQGYFAAMRMPLIAGRTFGEGSHARHEVIVSQSLARQLWPEGDAVGRRFRNAVRRPEAPIDPWRTVIGVVPDVVSNVVQGLGDPELYEPLGPTGAPSLIVRLASADALPLLSQFAESIRPGTTITNVRQEIMRAVAEPRFTMLIMILFAGLGVVLAAIGLFGVVSYSVGQRTREIGVRMTLGATRRSIARLVIGEGVRLSAAGIVIGLLGAAGATRLLQAVRYGVSPIDPFSFGVGALLLLATSVAACVLPMMRATAVDPAIAVRAE
jgi:putative ABC transport system permease protein